MVVTPEQREKKHTFTLTRPLGDTRTFEMAIDGPFLDTLALSLPQLFERVATVSRLPAPGTHDAVIIPTIDAKFEKSGTGLYAQFIYVLSGLVRVLDRSGAEVETLKAETRGETGSQELLGGPRSLSASIASLARRLGDDLATSRALAQYASASRPGGAVRPGGPDARPSASEITVSFSYPAEAARVAEDSVAVAGLVTSGRPLQRVELLVNGRPVPVSRDVCVQAGEIQTQPFNTRVPLLPGENVIVVTAVDTAGRGAQAARTVFREAAPPLAAGTPTTRAGSGERWAVVIGIDQYKYATISSLRYAGADAEAIFRFLTTRGGVKPANARLLLNQQATQRAIRQVLGDFLREKALRDDEVVIYYAGHGTTEPDASVEGGIAKYLVPWDADPQSLFSTAIPMEEVDRVFGRIAARKILMIQDTCFSGGAGGRTFLAKGLTARSTTLTDRFLQDLSQKEGRMILTASDVNQVSQEDPALGHGIFTHFLLEALGGAADLDGDGAVTVREVHLYLQRKVHERSAGVQTPQLYNIGDMVLVRK